jgi:TRAP-type C4-dicarboxylate transport system substrate-binding protein
MVRLMRDGTLQAGLLTVVGLSLVEPGVAGLQDFPMAFRSLEEFDRVGEKLQPALEARLAEKGFLVLFWADAGWVRFFSKEPMLLPSDLAKMKVFSWAGSPAQVDIMRKAGYTPVPLESADILLGLRTGMINVSPAPPIWALASQVYQVAPHMLELNWAPLMGACVVKKEAWEKIPAAAREEMRKAAAEAGATIKSNSRAESERAVKAMESRGLTVHHVTPEMEAQWRQAAEKVYPDIRGTLVPAPMFDEVMQLLRDFRSGGGKP